MASNNLYQIRITTACHKCIHKCCSQPHDWVFLTDEEITRIKSATGLREEEFVTSQENPVNGLRFKVLMLPCRFLDKLSGHCTIYIDRPLVCQLFPFYPEPLTGTIELIASQCGENLKTEPTEVAEEGWAINDLKPDIQGWLKSLWQNAGYPRKP